MLDCEPGVVQVPPLSHQKFKLEKVRLLRIREDVKRSHRRCLQVTVEQKQPKKEERKRTGRRHTGWQELRCCEEIRSHDLLNFGLLLFPCL